MTIFYYDSIAAAKIFYGETIGLKLILDQEWAVIFSITDTCQLALVEGLRGSQIPIRGLNKGAILSLVTDDVVAMHDRMVARNAQFAEPDIRIGCQGRSREFHLRDPGGYTIEFLQWLEPPEAQG